MITDSNTHWAFFKHINVGVAIDNFGIIGFIIWDTVLKRDYSLTNAPYGIGPAIQVYVGYQNYAGLSLHDFLQKTLGHLAE